MAPHLRSYATSTAATAESRARGLLLAACWTLVSLQSAFAGPAQEGDQGIAVRYPGDVGIEADPAVLFAEGFEVSSERAPFDRWDLAEPLEGLSLSGDVPKASSGLTSVRMQKKPGDGSDGARLFRRLLPGDGSGGYPRIHARMYVKINAASDPIHHFGTALGGNDPPTPWPSVRAGRRTEGDVSFWTEVEPYGDLWRWDFYSYWMEMRSWENEDGSGSRVAGNAFLRETAAGRWAAAGPEVRRGEWVCIEIMLELNDPVDSPSGEQAFWINGKLVRKDGQIVSHLGEGFPMGSWLRDKWSPDPGGRPFEGFRWRSSPDLMINFVWLYIYTEQDAHEISVSFDHLVVATDYVGPLAPSPARPR